MTVEGNVLFALGLTLLAGLSTGIGSAIALFARRSNRSFLAASLGFSGGVMVYISFVELYPQALQLVGETKGPVAGAWWTTAAFFAGMLLITGIDRWVPETANPHHAMLVEEKSEAPPVDPILRRMGLLSALAIGVHNFPEGMATFMAALYDPTVGVFIALAIALHNIPEGISISVPIYYATGSHREAFWLSFLSGVSEPVGAFAAYLVLMPFLSEMVLGLTFSAVAGVMVFISLDQLLPNAKKYGDGHQSVYGLILGMAVMALTLLMNL